MISDIVVLYKACRVDALDCCQEGSAADRQRLLNSPDAGPGGRGVREHTMITRFGGDQVRSEQ